MNKLQIKCVGSDAIEINELQSFQNNLKILSEDQKSKLKNSILENGFIAPVFIWKDSDQEGKNYILDGHQRLVVLKELQQEGMEIPKIPVSYIEAKNLSEAKKRLLLIASAYGKTNKERLTDYLNTAGLDIEVLDNTSFILSQKDLDNLIEEDPTIEPFKLEHICPSCGYEY